MNFPFGTNGKLMVLGVPIFKHFRVIHSLKKDALKRSFKHTDKLCPFYKYFEILKK